MKAIEEMMSAMGGPGGSGPGMPPDMANMNPQEMQAMSADAVKGVS